MDQQPGHKKIVLASRYHIILLFVFVNTIVFAQSGFDTFLTPSDTLDAGRRNFVIGTETVLATGTLVGLSQVWYKDYPQSSFHFINDNNDWLQMDKVGHVYSSYHIGKAGFEALRWSGVSRQNSLVYGSTLGLAFLTVVEVFDGYSAEWGASSGDMVANVSGTALFIGQELLWKEQRIIPKFSFHQTHYAKLRPDVLGTSFQEQLLKDYNGQTYWLSANLYAFTKCNAVPKWFNVAVGYGADGLVSGNGEAVPDLSGYPTRTRQFYLSFDVNLEKIRTKSHFLKTVFSLFNTIKIPAPAFEVNGLGKVKVHAFYF
ncbi:DUF2279 domain-containing protein [Flavobacterium pallidum]|uniref:DUF2279 domain-containing protein n=1 Tax=Flavobacterium pallidum TaxID=2172098 RepID=A0A2S1SDD7_9FLAO|nr:DUF2279 domain-containing protein [Flavobacterium pallidum]AWI24407.1 DUF2279 domain-containing protein [Flavobacterium pallidum]